MSEHEDGHRPRDESARTQLRRPGHELGAARERAGIPLEEMASRLHLSSDQVEALERDDYQHLPAAAFVRGYLRAYSREVGLDGDDMVAGFDAIRDESSEPELIVSHGVPDPATGRGPTIAILLVIVIAVVGAGAWWLQEQTAVELPASADGIGDSGDTTAGGNAVTATGDDDVATGETEAAAPVTMESAATEETASASGDTVLPDEEAGGDTSGTSGGGETGADVDAVADSGDMAGSPDDAGTDDDPQAAEPGTAEATTGADGTEPDALVADPEGPLATSDATLAASEAAATGPDRLEIRVDGESWLEVYDSRGRQLAYTLYSGSGPVVLNGWAPFEIFLGNSPDVTVRVDGVTVDQSAFVRSDNTARFIADREGARQR